MHSRSRKSRGRFAVTTLAIGALVIGSSVGAGAINAHADQGDGISSEQVAELDQSGDPQLTPEPLSADSDSADSDVPTEPAVSAELTEPTEPTEPTVPTETEEGKLSQEVKPLAMPIQNQHVQMTFERSSANEPISPFKDFFNWVGEVGCMEESVAAGCTGLTMTIPFPTQELPTGSEPYSNWALWFYWSPVNDFLPVSVNSEGTAWVADIPDALPGGETATYQISLMPQTKFVPSSFTFGIQPTISGTNFDSVTAANEVQFTGTAPAPVATPTLGLVSPANGSVLTEGKVSYQITGLFAGNGGGNGNAAPLPGSVDISVFLPPKTTFVSAEQDGAISGEYDPTTNAVIFRGVGMTWQEYASGTKQTFAPVVFQLDPDFKNDVFGNKVTSSLTSGIIGDPTGTYTSALQYSSQMFKMKSTVGTTDVISLGTSVGDGFGGNRFNTASGPAPLFGGQSSWSLMFSNVALPYSFEGQWAVPCRSGDSPNVKITGDATCAAGDIAFSPQSIKFNPDGVALFSSDGGVPSLPATVTYADGTTDNITITDAATALSGQIVSIEFNGDMPANQGGNLVISGIFPEGSMAGTPVEQDPANINFTASSQWSVKAAKQGVALPAAYDWTYQSGHPIILGTGSSVRSGTKVSPTGGEAKFASLVNDHSGEVEAAVLLPPEVTYLGWEPAANETGAEPTVTEDWNGTGATLLRFQWDGSVQQFVDSGALSWTEPSQPGHYPVTFAVNAGDNPFTGEKCWAGQTAGNPYSDFSTYSPTSGGLLENDTNGVCAQTSYFDVGGANDTLISGYVKTMDSPLWVASPGLRWADDTDSEGVTPGSAVEFMATASNLALGQVDNPTVCVSVPDEANNNPITGKSLENDYSMALTAAPTVPAGWTTQYSTDTGACEGQMSGDASSVQWQDDLPTDLGTVKAMKFEATSLAAGQSASFTYPVLLPDMPEYANTVAWAMPALSYESVTGGAPIANHAHLVGVGDVDRFNPWYGDLSAEVVGQDRTWARSGDTVKFTQKVNVVDNGFFNPYVAIDLAVPGVDGVTFDPDSVETSAGTFEYNADKSQIAWDLSSFDGTEATLSYEVAVGDNPPALVGATAEPTEQSTSAECPEGAACPTAVQVAIPQLAAGMTADVADGQVLSKGDKVTFDLALTPEVLGLDASAADAFAPVVTWDVSELQKHGDIEIVSAAPGEATYDKEAGTITWSGISWANLLGARAGLVDASNGALQAVFTAGASETEVQVPTSFSVQLGDDFTPVHYQTAMEMTLKFAADDGAGTTEPSVPGTTDPGTGEPGTGEPSVPSKPGSSASGGLASTGAGDVTGTLLVVMTLLALGAVSLVVSKRRS